MKAPTSPAAAAAARAAHPLALPASARWRPTLFPAAFVRHLLGRLRHGHLQVHLPDGTRLEGQGPHDGPAATLVLHRWRAVRRFATGGTPALADAYLDGDWDTPDLVALLMLGARNETVFHHGTRGHALARLLRRAAHLANRNSLAGSRRNIRAHYDLGNDFYRLWLDDGMSYSSALFSGDPAQSLEDAQTAKQDRAIALMAAQPEARVLEIGCGWGGLAERLVAHGHHVTGLTLSPAQCHYARARLATQPGRADIRLQDYRAVTEQFDAIVSIEMLEAVGAAYWPAYFAALRRALRPGGTIVLQAITIATERYDAYRRSADFIQTHIFPGGMLPSAETLRAHIHAAGLVLTHAETFAASYARTLSLWSHRFHAAWPRIAAMPGFSGTFRRKWAFYLAYCEAGFRTGALDVGLYQIRIATAQDTPP